MPQRSVATNYTFEQQRTEINLLAADFWSHKATVDGAASTYLKHDGSNDFTGGTLAVPSTFTINSDSGNGTVTIAGNLQVNGTTTTVNTATMDVVDKNITIAKGSANDAAADGAGITIDSATDITWNFVDANDAWVSSIGIEAATFLKGPYGQFTGSGTPSAGQGVEVNAPDANTGQISSYDRGNSAYKDLRIKGTGIDFYAGSTNAIVGGFHNTGIVMQSGKNIAADTLTSTGDVSIGHTSPTARFDVRRGDADGKIAEFHQNTGYGIDIGSSVSDAYISSGYNQNFIFKTDAGSGQTERLKINAGGSVEVIGTLNIDGNEGSTTQFSGYDALRIHNSNGAALGITANMYFTAGTGTNNRGAAIGVEYSNPGPGNALYFATNPNAVTNNDTLIERMRITPDGKVGVGHAIPTELLSLGLADDSSAKIEFRAPSRSKLAMIEGADDTAAVGDGNARGSLRFITRLGGNENERMRITSDGKVGINIDDNNTADLQVREGTTGAGILRVGGGTGGGTGLDINYSNSGTTKTIIKQNYRATNVAAELSFDSGLITFMTGTLGTDERLRITTDKVMTSVDFKPDTHQQRDIGTSSNSFKRIYGQILYDEKGDVRNVPNSPLSGSHSGGYVLVEADSGKCVMMGGDLTFQSASGGGPFGGGDVISVINASGSAITLNQGSGLTLYNTGDGTTGNRTLGARGMATVIYMYGGNVAYISGAQLT